MAGFNIPGAKTLEEHRQRSTRARACWGPDSGNAPQSRLSGRHLAKLEQRERRGRRDRNDTI
eukprot:1207253-Lingulodinium_polyedra.AAC.1